MKSIIYIGMDVHKKTYSLCALLKETGEIIGETKIPADVSLIIKFIENAKKSVDSDDVQIKTGYEAGCLGYSLYWQLAEKGIECVVLRQEKVPVKLKFLYYLNCKMKLELRNWDKGACPFIPIRVAAGPYSQFL